MGLEGWKAFRGSLYGNKKLNSCPLPHQDLSRLVDGLHSAIQVRSYSSFSFFLSFL